MTNLSRGPLIFAAALLLQLAGASQAASFLQNADGLVSMEAENAHRNIPQGSDQWTPESSPGGFSGTGVMVALPNNRTNVSSGFVNNSPRLDFDVNFTETGTHYLWIRANAPGFGDDSVHAGLNGEETPTATGIFLPGGGYTWSGGSETITIENLGLNTINLWMREDGARIDKIVLTTNASFVPTGTGPAESPQDSGGNQPPVAQNDTFSVLQGASATNLAVLANNGNGADSDANSDPLTVLSVGATSDGGSAVVNGGSNGVTYTPLATFTGQETFTYTISDGQGGTDSATVTVNVDPVGGGNQPPVAENDTFSVQQGASATNLAVLANNGNGADSDANNDPLTVLSVGATSNGGSAVVNGGSNGVTYTPLATFTGQETFTYTISDGQGGTDSATVTVNVNPVGGGGGNGEFLQDGQGLVSMEAENAQRNIPQGSDQWTAESSPGGFSGTGVMVALPNNRTNVSSGFVNNSPRLDFDVNFTATGTHYLWIRANAPGFSDDSVHAGLNGQETPTATGIFLPGGGYTWSGGSETITIENLGLNTINLWMREDGARIDKIVLTTNASFVPTGTGPAESPQDSGGNQPPVAQNDTFSVLQGASATNLAVLANNGNGADSDANSDPLTVLSVGATSDGGSAVVNGGSNGVTYTPLATFTGQETFTYTISDGQGGTDSATVTVNVDPVGGGNQPPVAENDTFSVQQGASATNLAVLANNGNGADSDANNDPLTVLSVGATSNGGSAVVNGGSNGVTYTPLATFTGQETFTYTISDGQGGTDSATVTVNVNPVGGGGGNGEFLQDGQGLVSMEAENAQRNIPQGSDQWTAESSPGGFSGTGVMVALPNNRTNVSSGFVNNSPRLDFDVNFTATGTHYLWIRANAPSFSDDSVHAGLNGQETPTATGIFLPGGGYTWSGGSETITIENLGLNSINLWMREDGARIDKIVLTTNASFVPTGTGPAESPQASACQVLPSVSMISPTQGHIQSSSTLTAEALGCLDPAQHSNWGVLFELDGGPSVGGSQQLDFSEPFTATFNGVAKAEHTVGAFVVDGSGSKVGGAGTSDVESNVGVGDYYVAIGDSITFGFGDDIAGDDTSLDGRNTGGGYTPVLNNLLTANRGFPHTVENEGIEGITSMGGLQALPAVIAAHPEAQRYLIKYGMNDARPGLPVPSGLGLNSGDAGYPGTFKANVQSIISLINDASMPGTPKEVVLAKVNIALGDGAFTGQYPDPDQGARSLLIKQYNQVVDELIAIPSNNISLAPPDFYSYFQLNYPTEYSDNVHPNGVGYQSMGNLWLQVIVP